MSLSDVVALNPSLATFLAVHRTGSITAAALALHLSQPATTRRLQALERQLGVPLFDRTPSGLRLSSAGVALLPHAERALAAERDGIRAVEDHDTGATGRLDVGVVGSLAGDWLTGVLRRVLADLPDLDLRLTTATSRQLRDQVLRGDLAIGIGYARPTDRDLEVRTLFDERLVVVGAPWHHAAGRRVRMSALRGERWLLFPEQPLHPESSGTIARRTLERHQVPAERLHGIDSLSAQRSLAAAGYGLAFLPSSAIDGDVRAGTLATIDVRDARVSTPVLALHRRDGYLGAGARRLLDELGS